MNILSNLWRRFRSKNYRDAFVLLQLKKGIPFQIGAMRKKLGWSQEQLAEASGLTQGVISRAENPDYGNLTLNTISRIAAGFDVAVVVRFVSFSNLVQWFENLSEEAVQVPTFTEEDEAERAAPVSHRQEEQEQPAVAALPKSGLQTEPQKVSGAAWANASAAVQPKHTDMGAVWGNRPKHLPESGLSHHNARLKSNHC
jgi:transcriptional regulator with XRE-family HTH domain